MAANQIQQILVKRGNTASISSYTGPLGELVLNTQTNQLVAQDGVTPGGRLVTGDTFPIVANLTVLQGEVANIAGISGNVAQLQSFFANVNLEGISTTIANLQLAANSSYGNANAAAYLPIYGGTVGTNLINFTNSNGQIESGETTGQPNSSWIEMTANIQHDIAGFYAAENGSAQVYSAQDVLLFSNTIGSTAPLWTFDRTGNLNLPSTTGRILFPYNENSNAIIDYSQDIGQFFVIQNNFVDGHQGINLDTDDAQVQISSKNSGGYPLRTWNFDWQGQLTYPDSTIQITAYQGPAGQTSFATQANVITANTSMKGYVDNQITLLVNNAPAILDTLGQIAANLQTDESSLTRVILGQAAANTQISALQANVGSYYIWANANTAGLYNSIVGANTAWTANAATQQGLITALQANTGGLYNSIAGANSTIQALSANVGSFYTWANTNFGTSSYANANVAAYLVANPQVGTYSNTNTAAYLAGNITTGNISVGSIFQLHGADSSLNTTNGSSINVNARLNVNGSAAGYGMVVANPILASGGLVVSGSSNATSFYGTNYYWANGVSLLSGIGGTYSNANVASYLLGNITTGNVGLSIGSWLDFRTTDQNWRIGYGLGAYTKTTAQTTIDVVVGQGQAGPDGFTVGQTGGASIFELVGYTKNAWFANNVTTVGNVTGGNVLATGFFYANGTPFTSSNYGNTQVAAYLVANPPAGTYSNSNVAAYLTTQTFYSNSNVAAYLVANPQGSTYSNANVTAYLSNSTASTGNVYAGNLIASGNVYGQNFVGNITTGANITASYFITTGAYGNISQVNTISANNYVYANGVSILTGITAGTGTYSNANVAAYLTTQTFYSNSNVAAYLVANPQGSTYSNANVVANLSNYVTDIVSTANITANYFIGNGAALSSLTYASIGNIYGSSSNVTLQAGNYNWTFDNTGNLSIPTNGNIIWANGTVFSSGTGGSGSSGTLYTNANVVSMLAANTAVFIGNVGNASTVYPLQSNITQLFVGGSTALTSGNAASPNSTFLMYNAYFAANGAIVARNTTTGAGYLEIDSYGIGFGGYTGAVTANTVPTFNQFLRMNGSIGAQFSGAVTSGGAVTGVGLTSTGGLTLNTSGTITTNQASAAIFTTTATSISIGGSTSTVATGGNLFAGNNLGVNTGNLSVRAQGNWNVLTVYGVAGGYNSPPYNNQALTGGSGTGMTASYSSTGGYISSISVSNPGTGYKNGDVLTVPGGLGSTVILSQYNSAIAGTLGGASSFTFTMDGSLLLPGNVSYASNASIIGDFTNSTVNNRTIFRPIAANSNPGVYTAPTGTGTAASWQAANSSNIANASKILIATNGTTDVQLVSGINGTGTYLPLSFYTNGSNQMQLGTAGNLNMVTGGNISTTGNVIAGNIVANQYGNSIGTTATYSGNVTASSVIASGSSGPQTRFLWDTWQTNSNVGLAAFTPSGTVGGNATWDSSQAYGLKLTTNTNSQSGYINWNSNTVNYNYDMVITASVGAGQGTGADGQWIYFGANAAVSGGPGNTNSMGGIAVMNHFYSSASQFEVYVNGTQTNIPYIGNTYTPSGITVWNGAYVNFYNLTLKIRKIQNGNRMLEIYLNEAYQGSVNIGSWTPAGNNFGVAAYTGGSTAYQWVRQLRIDW